MGIHLEIYNISTPRRHPENKVRTLTTRLAWRGVVWGMNACMLRSFFCPLVYTFDIFVFLVFASNFLVKLQEDGLFVFV